MKGGPAKNLYTKSERLTLSCRVTWAWSERVNFYSRQIMTLTRKKTKTYLYMYRSNIMKKKERGWESTTGDKRMACTKRNEANEINVEK